MSTELFRKAALDKIMSPEQLDTVMVVTRPRAWAALAALGLIVALLALWSVFSNLTTTASVDGMLLPSGGMAAIAAPEAGTVVAVAPAGGRVTAGQPVATIRGANGQTRSVDSPTAGRVVGVAASAGAFVGPGATLLSVAPAGQRLVAQFFAPVGVLSEIRRGMPVRLSPAGVNTETYGFLLGRVRTIFPYPASRAGAMALFQNAAVVQQLLGAGLSYAVTVALSPGRTPSGYAWTAGGGPSVPLTGGTLVGGTFVVSAVHPISLLFNGG